MILFCGEALMDMLPDTNAKGENVLRPVCGGAAYNSAVAAGRLGQSCSYLGGLSHDGFGQLLARSLEESGVDHSLSIRSERPTTLAVVTLSDGDATYQFYDEGSAGRMVEQVDLPPISDNISAIMFGGISLIPNPCGASYEALLLRQAKSHLIYMDPNIRPGFVTDETAYRQRLNKMIAASHIVKLSDDDMEWLMPNQSAEQAIDGLLAQGVDMVLHTKGGDGSTAWRKVGSVSASAPKITVVDTVGAGDTFNAAFLTGLADHNALNAEGLAALDDETLKEVLTFANKAGAITASRAGANPPLRSEIE